MGELGIRTIIPKESYNNGQLLFEPTCGWESKSAMCQQVVEWTGKFANLPATLLLNLLSFWSERKKRKVRSKDVVNRDLVSTTSVFVCVREIHFSFVYMPSLLFSLRQYVVDLIVWLASPVTSARTLHAIRIDTLNFGEMATRVSLNISDVFYSQYGTWLYWSSNYTIVLSRLSFCVHYLVRPSFSSPSMLVYSFDIRQSIVYFRTIATNLMSLHRTRQCSTCAFSTIVILRHSTVCERITQTCSALTTVTEALYARSDRCVAHYLI